MSENIACTTYTCFNAHDDVKFDYNTTNDTFDNKSTTRLVSTLIFHHMIATIYIHHDDRT